MSSRVACTELSQRLMAFKHFAKIHLIITYWNVFYRRHNSLLSTTFLCCRKPNHASWWKMWKSLPLISSVLSSLPIFPFNTLQPILVDLTPTFPSCDQSWANCRKNWCFLERLQRARNLSSTVVSATLMSRRTISVRRTCLELTQNSR